MTSIPDITRLLAWIPEWQEGHGKPGGRADAARRLEEANKPPMRCARPMQPAAVSALWHGSGQLGGASEAEMPAS